MLDWLLVLAAFWGGSQQPASDGAIRRIPAVEARQGVAASKRYLYAVEKTSLGRYDRVTGKRLASWSGDPRNFRHLNSCTLANGELVCAASNYPDLPRSSSVEYFDAETLQPLRSHRFGQVHGALTWIDYHQGKWWACFGNYDPPLGQPGRDQRATVLVRYSPRFQEERSWRFPDEVLARFAPMSASGGDWGHDGLLYVTGHDKHEIYAFTVPEHGDRLILVATLPTVTGGQAFDWDPDDDRLLWSVDRKARQIVASRIPEVVHR